MRRAAARLALLALVAAAPAPTGDWVGAYDCAQGPTGLALHLDDAPDGSVRGVFFFYADPRNPGVPSGCFDMRGTWDAARRRLVLHAGQWLVRPFGYVGVDLAGQVAAGVLAGTVDGPGCTRFRLRHGLPPVSQPDACRPPPPPPAGPTV